MKIETKERGIIEITEKEIYDFPTGLVGFEEYHKYALIESEYEPFLWLQAVDNKSLAFLLIDPFLICDEYEANIDDDALKAIGVKAPEDIIVMSIVTIPSGPNKDNPITANFLGPVIINKNTHQCMQVVLNDNRWNTKFDIIASLKKQSETLTLEEDKKC